MCGIVGAIAKRNIVPVLIEGLKRLEYLGFSPSMRTGTMLRLAIAPTIPHMRFAFRSLLLHRPLPVRNRHLLHAGEGQLPRRGVLGERGSCTECRAPAHAHRGD